MADGIINHDFSGRIEAFSAGTEPHGINSRAVQVMREIGIDISGNSSDHIRKYENQKFDYVISLCGDADEKCPPFFGGVERIHLGFEDPPRATGSEDEILAVFRRVRDDIRRQLGELFRKELGKADGLGSAFSPPSRIEGRTIQLKAADWLHTIGKKRSRKPC
jgi:arsenate reductase